MAKGDGMTDILNGKVLLMVGGTGGLGLSAARACAAAGARVGVIGRDPDRVAAVVSELGDAAFGQAGDASEPGVVDTAVDAVVRRWGRLDGLYHVAGGSGRRRGDGPLHDLGDAGWDYTIGLNLTSVFLSNRAAVRRFRAQGGGGSVVNCGSVLGQAPSPRFFATHAYAAAKAGIVGLTRSAAATYAPEGIRFNVVAPALVATPMSVRAQEDPMICAFVRTKQPLDGGRLGRPEDLDGAVVWLLSDGAAYVTGQVIAVDGGWSVSDGQDPRGTEGMA